MLVHTGTTAASDVYKRQGTYWYNDPYTLDFMRKDLKEKLIKAAK